MKISNDGIYKVIGVGDVCLQTNMRKQLLLRGIKHPPKAYFKLIYVKVLNDRGYDNILVLERGNLLKQT